jgi:hypothetical protein
MPAEYVAIREDIKRRCEKGDHPKKKGDESCPEYAKRLASIIYYKRTGKTPQEAESTIEAIEALEEYLRSKDEHS